MRKQVDPGRSWIIDEDSYIPVIAGSMVLVRQYRTIYLRSETRIALALEVYHSAANGDVDDSPNNEWSDRGLQVLDLKAAGALSCSCAWSRPSERGRTSSYSPHHACTMHPLADVAEPLLEDGKQT